jgi:hypothetical protein
MLAHAGEVVVVEDACVVVSDDEPDERSHATSTRAATAVSRSAARYRERCILATDPCRRISVIDLQY